MKNWILFITAAFLFFSGCQKDEAIIPMDELAFTQSIEYTAGIGEEIVLLYNQSVMIKPDGFTITFKDVPEDSRCPYDVNCIWEGRAVIKLIVENRTETHEMFLETPNTKQTNGQAINIFGRTIKLIDVAPYPAASRQITLKQYRLTILVDELESLGDEK